MIQSDFVRFSEMWDMTADVYGKTVTVQQVKFIFDILARYDIEEVRTAITRHLNDPSSGQYMPKPADIVKQLEGGADQRAWLAWSKVDQAIRRVGNYQSVVFYDTIIMATLVDMGGWSLLCSVPDNKSLSVLSHQFKTRYERYTQDQPREYPSHLIGDEEASCLNHNMKPPAPVMIGDVEKCRLVLQNGGEAKSLISRGNAVKSVLDNLMLGMPDV